MNEKINYTNNIKIILIKIIKNIKNKCYISYYYSCICTSNYLVIF